jgi:hypothetical protein
MYRLSLRGSLSQRIRSRIAKLSNLFPDPRGGETSLLGCSDCAFRGRCGTLGASPNSWDCFIPCKFDCLNGCPYVCPRSVPEEFVARLSELSPFGFEIENVIATARPSFVDLDLHVPRIDHGSKRQRHLSSKMVAIPLRFLVNFRTGEILFRSREALTSHFHLGRRTQIIVIGVAKDEVLEDFWKIRANIPSIASWMKRVGVVALTVPNFSSFQNAPRTEDLSNFVRAALVWRDFVNAHVVTAFHFNGRTEADANSISKFISRNPSLYWISAEFDTGARHREFFNQITSDLAALPGMVGRPLGLILHGGLSAVNVLKRAYERICFVDGSPFFKTVNRRELCFNGKGMILEGPASILVRQDELLAKNVRARRITIIQRITRAPAL